MGDGIPLGVRLTIESGIGCCDFSEFHKWAEKLMGYPIWTHEFAIPDLWIDLKMALLVFDSGQSYNGNRLVDPITTMRRIAPDIPIISIMQED